MCSFNYHLWHKINSNCKLKRSQTFLFKSTFMIMFNNCKEIGIQRNSTDELYYILFIDLKVIKNIIALMWLTSLQRPQLLLSQPCEFRDYPTIYKKNWKFICWVLLICPQLQYFSKKLPHSYSLPLILTAQKYYIVNLLSSTLWLLGRFLRCQWVF